MGNRASYGFAICPEMLIIDNERLNNFSFVDFWTLLAALNQPKPLPNLRM
ncbi:hypothetical protein TRP8649_00521 [Pelagimonas phthalicica]|uniref:Uncharacterized protein n=1 Tax=Pelagimonas phthalicica TaxID=1037362 RepID=A0A238J915_9RHOB|nr:hypothetical protein CLV87_1551 [Pelagimonas phthalicica]SMX26442.1 hypothetical protein TRP8649_00521 [Pelagimonas phthalicica]